MLTTNHLVHVTTNLLCQHCSNKEIMDRELQIVTGYFYLKNCYLKNLISRGKILFHFQRLKINFLCNLEVQRFLLGKLEIVCYIEVFELIILELMRSNCFFCVLVRPFKPIFHSFNLKHISNCSIFI